MAKHSWTLKDAIYHVQDERSVYIKIVINIAIQTHLSNIQDILIDLYVIDLYGYILNDDLRFNLKTK